MQLLFRRLARLSGTLGPVLALLCLGCAPAEPSSDLLVFAAASLSDLAMDLGEAFEGDGGPTVRFNFAGSNVLARQIEAAPKADVFLSADQDWVRLLADKGLLLPGSERTILRNTLVVAAHRDSPFALDSLQDLPALPFRHLALAEPEAVPAGRYARAYLSATPWQRENLWRALAPRMVPTLDVRAALGLVRADPKILGLVYRTDALSSPEVRILFELPPRQEVDIAYWGATVATSPKARQAKEFLDFLGQDEGRAIAARHGFRSAPESFTPTVSEVAGTPQSSVDLPSAPAASEVTGTPQSSSAQRNPLERRSGGGDAGR